MPSREAGTAAPIARRQIFIAHLRKAAVLSIKRADRHKGIVECVYVGRTCSNTFLSEISSYAESLEKRLESMEKILRRVCILTYIYAS